jgi:hypothetical protein
MSVVFAKNLALPQTPLKQFAASVTALQKSEAGPLLAFKPLPSISQ